MTYEEILDRMLGRIPDTYDKREGSIIYNALAPAAFELSEMYDQLEYNQSQCFVDTAEGDDLTRKCAELGISRKAATCAVIRAIFKDSDNVAVEVDIGDKLGLEDKVFSVAEADTDSYYILTTDDAGLISGTGDLIAIDYMDFATVTYSVTDYGTNEETDEDLRTRFYATVQRVPFGGNVADYRSRINAITGVGNCMVKPATSPGVIGIYLLNTNTSPAGNTLISTVQTAVDGFAPIGHDPTVYAPATTSINIAVTISNGTSQQISTIAKDYFDDLINAWCDDRDAIVVNANMLAYKLSALGTVTAITVNSQTSVTLDALKVPLVGTVTIS